MANDVVDTTQRTREGGVDVGEDIVLIGLVGEETEEEGKESIFNVLFVDETVDDLDQGHSLICFREI